MKKKYLAKLLSYALSAAMALTSVVPSYAMENADASAEESSVVAEAKPEADADVEKEDEQEPTDEETEEVPETAPVEEKVDVDEASDKDPEEKVTEGTETEETVVEAEETPEAAAVEEEEEEPAETESTGDVTITFDNDGAMAKTNSGGTITPAVPGTNSHAYVLDPDKNMVEVADDATIAWASENDLSVEIIPATGYLIDTDAENVVTVADTTTSTNVADDDVDFEVALTAEKATVTIFSSYLKTKKTSGVTLKINNNITKGDTFSLKTEGTTMGASASVLKLQYGAAANKEIDFTNFQPSSAPITGFRLYEFYGDEDEKTEIVSNARSTDNTQTDGMKDADGLRWYYDSTAHTLYLHPSLINSVYTSSKDLTAVAQSNTYTISQADTNCELQYNLNGSTSYITSSTDFDTALEITMKSASIAERTFTGASYVITYDDGTTKENNATFTPAVSENHRTPAKAAINANEFKVSVATTGSTVYKYAKTVAVTAKTADSLSFTAAEGTTESWYVAPADTTAETGEDYDFTIKAATGYKITNVSYKLGDPTKVSPVSLGVSADNEYTIEKVNNKVTIIISAAKAENNVNVSARVKNADGQTANIGSLTTNAYNVVDKNTKTSLATAGSFAKVGEDYEFIITEGSHAYSVKEIKYSLGGEAEEYGGIVAVDAAKGVYKIPGSLITTESPIEIIIYSYDMVSVQIPGNKKAVLSVGGTAKDDNFYIKKGESFTFSVAGKTSSVKVNQVKYTIDGTDGTTPDLASSYTIDGSKVTGNIVINVKTTETPASGDYTVKFTADGNSNYGWTASGKEILEPTATNAVLNISRGKTAVLTPVVTDSEGDEVVLDTTNYEIKYEQSSKLTNYDRVAIITKTADPAITADVNAQQIGTEVLKYSISSKNTSESDDFNTVSYSGTLNIEVKPAVTITLEAENDATTVRADSEFANKSGSDSKIDYAKWNVAGKRLTIAASVIDTVKHTRVVPSAANIEWVSGGAGYYITRGDATLDDDGDASQAINAYHYKGNAQSDPSASSLLVARVAASAASGTAGTFNIKITDKVDVDGKSVVDEVYTAATPISILATEDKNYASTVSIKLAGGDEIFVSDNTDNVVDAPITLDATDIRTANIEFKLYELGDDVDDITGKTPEYIEELVEDKDIVEVTPSYTMSYYKHGDAETIPASTAFTVTGSNGKYTAEAKSAVAYNVDFYARAEINNAEIAMPLITFIVNGTSDKINVPLQIDDYLGDNDSSNDIELTLNKTGYLKGKNYSDGYAQGNNDGYLFKIAKGTSFTLPLESDFDKTTYKNTKRKLVGWAVTTTAVNNIKGTGVLTKAYYMPGQSFVANASINSITPIWEDRYTVDDGYMFRDHGEKKTITIYTDSLVNNVPTETEEEVSVALDDISLSTGNIPKNASIKLGAKVEALRTNAWYNTDGSAWAYSENDLYPEVGTGNGTIQWKAYDEPAGGRPLDVTDSANATAISKLTVFDATELSKGILKPLTTGSAFVYYEYKDEYGNVYSVNTGAVKLTVVDDEVSYTIDLSSLPDTIQVGETIATTSTTGAKIRKITETDGSKPYLSVVTKYGSTGAVEVQGDDTKFEYTVSSGLSVAEFEPGDTRNYPVITGKAVGTQTISLKITDADGVTATSTVSKTITVTAADVTIDQVDATGKATTATPEVERATTGTSLYVTATNAAGNAVAGTFTYTSSDTDVYGNAATTTVQNTGFKAVTNHPDILRLELGNAGSELGTTKITVTFTASTGKKYTKEFDLKSYATLTFNRSKAVPVNDGSATIRESGYVSDEIAKMTVTGTGGEKIDVVGTATKDEDKKDYLIKIYADNFNEDGEYTLSLAPFSVAYTGTKGIEFAGWTGEVISGSVPVATKLEDVRTSIVLTNLVGNGSTIPYGCNAKNFVIAPQFKDASVSSINTSVSEVSIDNLSGTTSQVVEISTTPMSSAAELKAKTDVSNTGAINAFFIWDDSNNISGAKTGDELEFGAGTAAVNVRKYNMIIGTGVDNAGTVATTDDIDTSERVGKATITISAAGSSVTKAITLNIYGQYSDTIKPTAKRYRNADGETDARDTSVVVNNGSDDVTRFYDEDGYLITTAGSAHDAKGNLVLLKADAGAGFAVVDKTEGYRSNIGAAGYDYFVKDGIVQTGLFEVNGVQRYANTKGVLITYAMTKDGIYTDPVTGIAYKVEEGTNKTEADHEHKWTDEWTWDKTTYAAAHVKITCSVGGESYEADVPSTSTQKGNVYTYNASYEYAGQKFDAPTQVVTKDSSGKITPADVVSEGIVIIGLEDEYEYTGVAIKPAFVVEDLSNPKEVLALGVDYTVSYKDNKGSATQKTTATITIKGKGNYTGQNIKATFDIVPVEVPEEALSLAGAKLTLPSGVTYYYNGEAQYPETFEIKYKGESTPTKYTGDGSGNYSTEDGERPVAVSFSNNVNKGSATILVTGASVKGKATTLKKTFSIKAATLSKVSVTVETDNSWAVKGATPSVAAVWTDEKTGNTIDLVEGQDFKVTYANNKKVNTSATVKLTGKGNFTGTVAGQEDEVFGVSKLDLADTSKVTLVAATVAVGTKANSVKVTVLDEHGDVIPASRYTVEVEKDGAKLDGKTPLTAGAVTVKAVAKAGSDVLVEGSVAENDFNVAALNLSKASVKVNGSMTYTGEELRPDNDWFNENVVVTIKNGKTPVTLKAGEDFTVTGYTNNIKKGTMKVTIVGLGDDNTDAKVAVSGTKTVNVKIVARSLAN